jgi:putative flippase GtrA
MRILTKVTNGSGLSRTRLLLWAKYSAASVVATVISQVAFALCYWFGTAPIVATLVAWVCGTVPSYLMNRRTWGHGGRPGRDLLPYAIIVVTSAVLAGLVTTLTDHFVQDRIDSHFWQTVLVSGSYLGTYGVLFILKFVLFDRYVFAKPAAPAADPAAAQTPVATSSSSPARSSRRTPGLGPSCWSRRRGAASSSAAPRREHRGRVRRATTPTTGTAAPAR